VDIQGDESLPKETELRDEEVSRSRRIFLRFSALSRPQNYQISSRE